MKCELQRPVMISEIGRNFEKLPSVATIRERVEKVLVNDFSRTAFDNRVNLHPAGTSKSQHGMLILPDTVWRDVRANNIAREFAGQLSTDPEKVGPKVNQLSLTGKCEIFSNKLQPPLKKRGIDTTIVEGLWLPHFSLRTIGRDGEIIIDPTSVQYIPGLSRVFVGQRDELKSAVLEHAKQDKLSYFDTSGPYPRKVPIRSDPEAFFENQWPSLFNPRVKERI